MNQIINMIIRQVMRKLVNKGVEASFNKASSMGRNRQQQPQGDIDDYGNPVQNKPTQDEIRAARRARRQSGGQTKQAVKMVRRISKF